MTKPSTKLDKKIIGTIKCHIKGFDSQSLIFHDLGSFSVIDIEKDYNSDTVYVCDQWDGENPQKISERYVNYFIPIK